MVVVATGSGTTMMTSGAKGVLTDTFRDLFDHFLSRGIRERDSGSRATMLERTRTTERAQRKRRKRHEREQASKHQSNNLEHEAMNPFLDQKESSWSWSEATNSEDGSESWSLIWSISLASKAFEREEIPRSSMMTLDIETVRSAYQYFNGQIWKKIRSCVTQKATLEISVRNLEDVRIMDQSAMSQQNKRCHITFILLFSSKYPKPSFESLTVPIIFLYRAESVVSQWQDWIH